MKLAHIELNQSGRNHEEAVVFLHGFGGWASQWCYIQDQISMDMATLAFDLPGHGGSSDYPGFGPPKVAANAVIDGLSALQVKHAHLVGHSMGGAVAALIAMLDPRHVASLTLLAPGGFGPEINSESLFSFGKAHSSRQFAEILPDLYATGYPIDDELIDTHVTSRQRPGVANALMEIAKSLFQNGTQGTLPLEVIFRENLPTQLIWGSDDKILPSYQAENAPDHVDVHIVPGAGHTLYHESPQIVLKTVRKQLPI